MSAPKPKWLMGIAVIAILFGLATIVSGGRSLFTTEGALAAGNYVLFVLWFNFLAGFAYIAAGFGLLRGFNWARSLAIFLALTTSLVFILFGIHIFNGGAYEGRTVAAMILRSGFWGLVAIVLPRQS